MTCGWIFSTKLFLSWRLSVATFVWVHGKPGAGKSVLTWIRSAVIDELKKEILRSLLVQLLRNSDCLWSQSFADLVDSHDHNSDPPVELDLLLDLLMRAARLHERPMIVIDALDECSDLPDLPSSLLRLNNGYFHTFVTSRTEYMIKEASHGIPSLSTRCGR
ncbi:hypothetical protein BS17DRAFT_341163 [Gyrodon lividus]|nr:hypothetical protein BS17DRAFT_341163 [Gyrodon lividus]